MTATPRVSVVIPARNAQDFVGEAVRSVLAQTYTAIETVLVDDGSIDETGTRASAASDGRVRILRTEGVGIGAARNLGWRATEGELVAFLDADDLWLPDKIQLQVDRLDASPGTVAVGSFMRHESLRGRILGVTGQPVSADDAAEVASGRLMPFPISSVLVRRNVLEQLGGFDPSLSVGIPGGVEDLDLMARLASVGGIATVPRVLGVYRVHPSSATAQHFRSQRLGTRFVRARIAARAGGRDVSWEDFVTTYRPTRRQRRGDLAQGCYRSAGVYAADNRWVRALCCLALALLVAPGYVTRRIVRQQRLRLAR